MQPRVASLSLALTLLAIQQGAPAPPAPSGTGTLRAHVRWKGELPEPLPPLAMKRRHMRERCCGDGVELDSTDRTLVVSEQGGIADVVVTLLPLDGAEPAAVPDEPFVLEQRGGRLEPHVLVVPAGARVAIRAAAPGCFNPHSHSRKNPAFNVQVTPEREHVVRLERAEVVPIVCDLHAWMRAYVVVTDGHAGASDAQGELVLRGLPAGRYRATWWHERLGKGVAREVAVAAGGTSELTLELGPDRPR